MISSTPAPTGSQSQMAIPPSAWNGWANSVNTVVVTEIIEKARANEVYEPIVRFSCCL